VSLQHTVGHGDVANISHRPSLGTNFTLACPYTILAHYTEMDWTSQFGVEPDLVRVSVGLEEPSQLHRIFKNALEAASRVQVP